MVSDFKKLHVWRKAHGLALSAHRLAGQIRGVEHASLRSQIVRSAMSIPANIVEGRGQKTEREFARFLKISLNSSSELEYHLIVARDIRAIDQKAFLSLVGQVLEVRMMLHGLLKRLPYESVPSRQKKRPDVGSS